MGDVLLSFVRIALVCGRGCGFPPAHWHRTPPGPRTGNGSPRQPRRIPTSWAEIPMVAPTRRPRFDKVRGRTAFSDMAPHPILRPLAISAEARIPTPRG